MQPHTRALVAASACAFIVGRKVAGLYDHAGGRHLRIAAESRDDRLQGLDGDRSAKFGGTLPEIYAEADRSFVSLEIADGSARGYDRGSSSAFVVQVSEQQVQIFDYGENVWFAFDVQFA